MGGSLLPNLDNSFIHTPKVESLGNITVSSLMKVGKLAWDEEVVQDLFKERMPKELCISP